MGPTIVLDKSTLQALPKRALYELSRYFYTNVTPVLLMEILADLRLSDLSLSEAQAKVAQLASKLLPFDSITNLHYQSLCVADLLGGQIPMNRVPVVGGGKKVVAADGREGIYVGVQAEREAVLRWRHGEFSESDREFANRWRNGVERIDFDRARGKLTKPDFKLKSLEELDACVDYLLHCLRAQEFLRDWFMDLLRLQPYVRDWVRSRWRNGRFVSLRGFAPYATHCLRVNLLFYMGMSHGLVGTRKSNLVDLEYLCYTPFAQIFSSGDKFLRDMASIVLSEDQSFVWHQDLRGALVDVADRREASPSITEPLEASLIPSLWKKHLGRFCPQAKSTPISPERSAEIMAEIKPIMDSIDAAARQEPKRPPWPL